MKYTLLFIIILSFFIQAQPFNYEKENQALYNEHIKYSQPDNDSLLIRIPYVLSYNTVYRIPNWVAYHIIPDYLNTPKRKGKFKSLRTKNDVEMSGWELFIN